MIVTRIPAVLIFCLALGGCAATAPVADEVPGASDVAAEVSAAVDENAIPVIENDYILDRGDKIYIQVFDEPDLTLETVVGTSGSINYSYLGDVKVSGKSPSELERYIADLLQNGYLVNPSVNVSVIQYRPFYINGEVRSPGGYPYQLGLTLDKAIALAGGLTDRASTRKMYVTKGGDQSQEGEKITFKTRIQPGDIITIEEGFF